MMELDSPVEIENKTSHFKQITTSQDVLTNEFSHEELNRIYVEQELPAALVFIKRFESWLKENLVKLTLNYLNTTESSPEYNSPVEFFPPVEFIEMTAVEDTEVENDLTSSLECVLCKFSGQKKVSGRLLPTEEGHWVHSNCAYWSNDVKFDEIGFLYNFEISLSKAKKNKCKECGKPGATLACIGKRCSLLFHFPCALNKFLFYDSKTIICPKCNELKKPPGRLLSPENLSDFTNRKFFITKGKKFSKKPEFARNTYNRIGSLILFEIPEENNHERLLSFRLSFYEGKRALFRCEHNNGIFSVSVVVHPDSETNPSFSSENIEDLWPFLNHGPSFILESAADFFGYSYLGHFLPPKPETHHYRSLKQHSTRSLADILQNLKPSLYGSSILAPFDKHLTIEEPNKKESVSVTHKSVNFEDSYIQELKTENALATEYRKYRKNPMREFHLEVLQSNIHGLGLFTSCNIAGGNIVIEYIGEIVRNPVADRREIEYEEKGIGNGSCYMFRLDAEYVLDATVKGGKARFINHSCQNNCEATICNIDGEKHILLFAKRLIYKGEEITYDYNFEVERDKIPCSCGAVDCQGRLN